MDAVTLIADIRNHGLNIQAIDGSLHISPHERITDNIRTQIKAMKEGLLDFMEKFEERAAIMQHCAHDVYKTKEEAEAAAFEDLMKGQNYE